MKMDIIFLAFLLFFVCVRADNITITGDFQDYCRTPNSDNYKMCYQTYLQNIDDWEVCDNEEIYSDCFHLEEYIRFIKDRHKIMWSHVHTKRATVERQNITVTTDKIGTEEKGSICYSQIMLIAVTCSSTIAGCVLGCFVTFVVMRRLELKRRRQDESGFDEDEAASDSDTKNSRSSDINHPELYESGRYVSITDSREHTYESMRKIVYRPNYKHREDDDCLDYLPLRNVPMNRVSEVKEGIEALGDNIDGLETGGDQDNEADVDSHEYFVLEPHDRVTLREDDVFCDLTSDRVASSEYCDSDLHRQGSSNNGSTCTLEGKRRSYASELEMEDEYESYDEDKPNQSRIDFGQYEISEVRRRESARSRYDDTLESEENYSNINLEHSLRLYSGLADHKEIVLIHNDGIDDGVDGESFVYDDEFETYQEISSVDNERELHGMINYIGTSLSNIRDESIIQEDANSINSNAMLDDDSVFLNEGLPDAEVNTENYDKVIDSRNNVDEEAGHCDNGTRVLYTDIDNASDIDDFPYTDNTSMICVEDSSDRIEDSSYEIPVSHAEQISKQEKSNGENFHRQDSNVYINVGDVESRSTDDYEN